MSSAPLEEQRCRSVREEGEEAANTKGCDADAPKGPADPSQPPVAPRDADAKDDVLAEHLADVVRDQIAESLPQQIKALAPHLLDEDILRPVVAEMIRKELSGALGEKITQGVRKLVRQELNRAITLRRLE